MRQLNTFHFSLLLQDRNPGFHVWRLDIGDQAPFKAISQAVLESWDLFGKLVRSDDDLSVGVVKGIKGVEKLLLGSFLAGDELDIVKDQDVDVPEFSLKFVHLVPSQGGDELIHERFGTQVDDFQARALSHRVVADRVDEVSLTEADTAVDEKRVVMIARLICHCDA